MITGFFITMFFNVISYILGFFPTGGFPADVASSLSVAVGSIYIFNGFFPIDTLLVLVGWSIIIQGIVLVILFSFMIINKIRGV
jgi:hypothetical protein